MTGDYSKIFEAVRANGWRQGNILPTERHAKLASHINRALSDDDICIVITHSCELVRADATFEIVIGRPTGKKKIDDGFAHGRSRKKIELNLSVNGQITPVVIVAIDRYNVPIEILAAAKPDDRILADDLQREALVEWLVARYARPGFPNNFEVKLRPQLDALNKVVKKLTEVWRIYLGLSSWNELPDGETYEVELYFVIEDAHYQKVEIRREVLNSVYDFKVTIERCNGLRVSQDHTEMVVSDEEFPIASERKFRRWERFDYVSLAYPDHVRDEQ